MFDHSADIVRAFEARDLQEREAHLAWEHAHLLWEREPEFEDQSAPPPRRSNGGSPQPNDDDSLLR